MKTTKFKQWSETTYYGSGFSSPTAESSRIRPFAGYAATIAYPPACKLAIAVSVTLGEKASQDGNLSTEVLKEIAAYLAPVAPFKR